MITTKPQYKITFLGCGASGGVPSIEDGFGKADSTNIKNTRLRSSIYLQVDNYSILFDTTPDLRQQLLKNNIKKVDSLIYTHAHADHINGIDDIRSINRLMKAPIDCYLSKKTFDNLYNKFTYAFLDPSDIKEKGYYRPILVPHVIDNYEEFSLNTNIKIKAVEHNHGFSTVFGYIIDGKIGYLTDFHSFLDGRSTEEYKNLDVLIVSCCVTKKHPCHIASTDLAELLKVLKPKRAYLTHMSAEIDYREIKKTFSENTKPAYDNLEITL